MVVYEVRVSLLGIEPEVWRRVRVPGDLRLSEVHFLLQIIMGWTNSHQHEYVGADRKRYGSAEGHELLPGVLNESQYRLSSLISEPGDGCLYIYDFGDDWSHEIVLEAVVELEEPDEPLWCLGGQGACPPEDCGGVPGYFDLLEQLKDSDAEGHQDVVELYGEDFDPEAFDCTVFNQSVTGGRSRNGEMMNPEEVEEQMRLLAELQDFLHSDELPESTMSLFMLDGFFAALAIHPVTLMPNQWLPYVWDISGAGQQPGFISKAQVEKGLGLMLSYMNFVVDHLSESSDEYLPLFEFMQIESEEERMKLSMDWAVGFMVGATIDKHVWERTFGDEEGADLLMPFIVMSGFLDEKKGVDPVKKAELRKELIDEMGDYVLDMQEYWAPMRRDFLAGRSLARAAKAQPRVGRNDPCPCGSGKKFKQCCGK